jgi:hypothetical protein
MTKSKCARPTNSLVEKITELADNMCKAAEVAAMARPKNLLLYRAVPLNAEDADYPNAFVLLKNVKDAGEPDSVQMWCDLEEAVTHIQSQPDYDDAMISKYQLPYRRRSSLALAARHSAEDFCADNIPMRSENSV